MANDLTLMLEAEKRGILPPDRAALLAEARKRGLLSSDPSPPTAVEESLKFTDRIKNDLKQRETNIQNIPRNEQTAVETGLQTAGQTAQAALDVVGETVVSGVKAVLPDFVEDELKEGFSDVGEFILSTEVGQLGLKAAQTSAEAYDSFKSNHPRAARNLEAVINVGLLLAPAKKPKLKTDKTVVTRMSELLDDSAKQSVKKQRQEFVEQLVRPEQLKRQRIEQTARTDVVGPLQRKVIKPSVKEANAAAEVVKIPGVRKNNIIQKNLNEIQKEVDKEVNELITVLNKKNVLIPKQQTRKNISDKVLDLIEESPQFTGDPGAAAKRVLRMADKIVEKNSGTAAGLLKARKQLDREVEKLRKNLSKGEKKDAIALVYEEIRNSMNDTLAASVKDVKVKESLAKTHNLLNAVENMRPKAAAEASNAIERLVDGMNKTKKVDIGNTLGNRLIRGIEIAGQGISKGVMNPKNREALSAFLKIVDKTIKTTKDEAIVKQLRTDRAVLLEIIKTSSEQEKEQ